MQKRFDILLTLACPCCEAECVVTLGQVHDGEAVRCSTCRTLVSLEPECLAVPPAILSPRERTTAGIRFA